MRLHAATKGGRAANGFERDHGRVVHGVMMRDPKGYETGPALCGTQPGWKSVGWSHVPGGRDKVTCPRCRKKLPPAEDTLGVCF